jgi:mannosyltransferase
MANASPLLSVEVEKLRISKSEIRNFIFLIAILLLALGLRAYRLDSQSLWNDEGTSVALATRSLGQITQGAAADIHPPLYYYLLHFWQQAFGQSEKAVRSLSVLVGVLLVFATYLLGQRLRGAPVGLLAAFLAAVSPFQVYYSQETRMYILAALLSAVSVYLLVLFVGRPASISAKALTTSGGIVLLVAWVVVTAAAVYSHYFAFTVVLAENLAFGLWLLRDDRNPFSPRKRVSILLPWLAAQVAVALLFLPWLRVILQQWGNWPATSEPFGLPTLLVRAATVFSLGRQVEPAAVVWPVAAFSVVFLLGVLPWGEWEGGRPLVSWPLLVLYCFTPILVMYLLSLRRPLYEPKHLLVAAPAYALLLGNGLWRLAAGLSHLAQRLMSALRPPPAAHLPSAIGYRPSAAHLLSAIGALGLAAATVSPLAAYYFDPRQARDDYRGLVRYVQAASRTGDAILLDAPGQVETFDYYYHGALPRYPLPQQRPIDERATEADLQRLMAQHSRIWGIFWAEQESDPHRFIERWLDDHAYKATDRWFGSVRLTLYAVPLATPATIQHPQTAFLGDSIQFLGYSLGPGPTSAGDILQLTLYWQAVKPIGERYKVFTHLLDPGESIWGQRDAEPGGDKKITTTWKPGEVVPDNYGLLVLPGTPPGTYNIEIGMYRADTGQRLPIFAAGGRAPGDRLLLGPVQVVKAAVPPSLEELAIQHPLSLSFEAGSPYQLLGYDLHRLGQAATDVDFRPGDVLHLTLYWQSEEQPSDDLVVAVQVISRDGRVLLRRENRPADGHYPTFLWDAGEIVRDQHKIPLGNLPPGEYHLTLGVYEALGTRPLPVRGDVQPASDGFLELARFTVR